MPQESGSRSATLTIGRPDAQAPPLATIALVGTGALPTTITADQITVAFGSQPLGAARAPQTVTFTNTGTDAIPIGTPTLGTTDYTLVATTCSATTPLAASASCTAELAFKPQALGSRPDTLTVPTAGSTPEAISTVTLSGTGTLPATFSASPATFDFGNQGNGTTSSAHDFPFTNGGSEAITVGAVSSDNTVFAIANAGDRCANQTIPAGGDCTIAVTFTRKASAAPAGHSRCTASAQAWKRS